MYERNNRFPVVLRKCLDQSAVVSCLLPRGIIRAFDGRDGPEGRPPFSSENLRKAPATLRVALGEGCPTHGEGKDCRKTKAIHSQIERIALRYLVWPAPQGFTGTRPHGRFVLRRRRGH